MTLIMDKVFDAIRELTGDRRARVVTLSSMRQTYHMGEARLPSGDVLWSADLSETDAAFGLLAEVLTWVGVVVDPVASKPQLLELIGEAKAILAARALGARS